LSRLSDTGLLVPAFRERLERALLVVRGQGYSPVVIETLRSRDRAAELVKTGKSMAKDGLSMHCYGVAADIICGDHQWDCRRHQCAFFDVLGAAAEDAGLTWGGRWKNLVDLPHIQAVPVRLQKAIREMDQPKIDDFVRQVLGGRVP
jgi:peptidoglycan L-alanyl-D-glutamate endopeptidase CwlK